MPETDLYPPIKRYLEAQGYQVKAEIGHCDVVAMRGDEPPLIVELKTSFSLELLFQAIDRQTVSEDVYVAFPLPRGQRHGLWARHRRSVIALCRRLGLGLLTVGPGDHVDAQVDPLASQPRKNKRRQGLLLREFERRVGDPNHGGSTRKPLVTAYRQDVLRCVRYMNDAGPSKVSDIRRQAKVERAAGILRRDVYGWFEKIERGRYGLSARGVSAVSDYQTVIGTL